MSFTFRHPVVNTVFVRLPGDFQIGKLNRVKFQCQLDYSFLNESSCLFGKLYETLVEVSLKLCHVILVRENYKRTSDAIAQRMCQALYLTNFC